MIGGERAQPVQVGVIVLFGFLVVALAVVQATVVPQENGKVEFRHNQEVQERMADVRASLLRAAATGQAHPVSVPLGTDYPPRILTRNPPSSSGNLRTVAPGGGTALRVENAEAVEREPRDFWGGGARSYETRGLVYRPNYNVYGQAPETGYENSVRYNRDPSGAVATLSDQRLVDGRKLDLTVLQGTYRASGSQAASVDVSSPSAAPRTVVVRATSDTEPIRVTVPTALPESTWEELLADELGDDGRVASLSKSDGELTIELEPTDGDGNLLRYELRVAPAGVGSGVPEPTAAYLTDVSGDGATVPENGSQQVVAEVRDEFNGPELGVGTCAAVTAGPGALAESPTTEVGGADGRVDYTYLAPSEVSTTETATVTVSYDCDGDDPAAGAPATANATFDIDVYDAG